jgi:hypothetical protein
MLNSVFSEEELIYNFVCVYMGPKNAALRLGQKWGCGMGLEIAEIK